MPAPRAVLHDVHELGLDPTKPYTQVTKSGCLKPDTAVECSIPADEARVDVKVESDIASEKPTEKALGADEVQAPQDEPKEPAKKKKKAEKEPVPVKD